VSEAKAAIYAAKTLVNPEVDFCLIPEVPFTLEGFLAALKARVAEKGHAVVVAGEGAGQYLIPGSGERDASGNIRFGDIGVFLRDRIREDFRQAGLEVNLKYIDPSYMIRSMPANPHDSAFCLLLGYHAVHAGMAGRTSMVVGNWKRDFTHVPIRLAVSQRKHIDPADKLWNNVLAAGEEPKPKSRTH